MERCIIITAFSKNKIKNSVNIKEDDFIICADGGYDLAVGENILPDLVIGDMDSGKNVDYLCKSIYVQPEKDDTDTMLCLKHGINVGYKHFVIVGGIGGRLDHTYANLQTLVYAADKGVYAELCDGENRAFILCEKSACIQKCENTKLSVFAFSDVCEGVNIEGAKYTLKDAALSSSYPLGVSNEFESDFAKISVKKGKLLIILSKI